MRASANHFSKKCLRDNRGVGCWQRDVGPYNIFLKVFEEVRGAFFKKPPAVGLWLGELHPVPTTFYDGNFS